MNQLLIQYSYLQMLDFLTTVAFLFRGVQEANPFVRFALHHSPNPWSALLMVKLVALSLGFYCWRVRKERLLTLMNVMFAVLVAWNMAALIMAS